jgi:hypothetical protein
MSELAGSTKRRDGSKGGKRFNEKYYSKSNSYFIPDI